MTTRSTRLVSQCSYPHQLTFTLLFNHLPFIFQIFIPFTSLDSVKLSPVLGRNAFWSLCDIRILESEWTLRPVDRSVQFCDDAIYRYDRWTFHTCRVVMSLIWVFNLQKHCTRCRCTVKTTPGARLAISITSWHHEVKSMLFVWWIAPVFVLHLQLGWWRKTLDNIRIRNFIQHATRWQTILVLQAIGKLQTTSNT